MESILKNIIIAASVVYLAFLTNTSFSIPFLPFIPENLSVGAVILPLILWPIYKIISDMTFIVKHVTINLITRTFPAKNENVEEVERLVEYRAKALVEEQNAKNKEIVSGGKGDNGATSGEGKGSGS